MAAGGQSCLSDAALNQCRQLGRRIAEQHRKRQLPWQPGLEFDWLPSVLEKKLKDESYMPSLQSADSSKGDSSMSVPQQTSVQHPDQETPIKHELDKSGQMQVHVGEGPSFTITDDVLFDEDTPNNFPEPEIKSDTVKETTTECITSNVVPPAPEPQGVEGEVEVQVVELEESLSEGTLPKEFSDVLTELHQRWTQGEQVEFGPEHHFFTSCSPQQMESACVQLRKLGLSEVALCSACHFMVQVTPPPSHTSCCVFIRQCLLPQINGENESGSRVLSAAVVAFARKYPRPFVETAVVPLLTTIDEGSWLWDVLHRLVTEADTQKQDLKSILQVLYGAETWSESTVALLQTAITQKPTLDNSSLSDLTSAIHGQAVKLNSNLKFTKLILAVINTYGKQMSQDDIKNINSALDYNQTFLKRASLVALKRVTK